MQLIFYTYIKIIFIILQLFLFACSGHEKSEQDRLRQQNAKGEYVYRHHNEQQYPVKPPTPREREPYPWE